MMGIDHVVVDVLEAPEATADGQDCHSASSDDWRRALARVVPAVVVLRVTAVRDFDTEVTNSSHATGFVVDRRRGIILTNRHFVKPVVAEAMFVNREEVPVHAVYREPVHDFGFFHFDPAAVRFLDYHAVLLAPEAAAVGLEIRVVGNDSGEKVSILAGTIARLDRDAPVYGALAYNDFNMFYLQAASGKKGGSSGSPVIDSRGRAVALNAGSKSLSASAFYLPLNRVVRALSAVQACFKEKEGGGFVAHRWCPPAITRGTLQVTFRHKGFEETRRLGLRDKTEAEVRHGTLEVGDVFVRVNGKVLTQFLALETILDDTVGSTVTLDAERGGTPLSLTLSVNDLHAITPHRFLELSGGVLHVLSYQQARNFRFPCGLVYVTEPGYMLSRAGVLHYEIIQKLNQDVPDLDAFIRVFVRLQAGARVPIQYVTVDERHQPKQALPHFTSPQRFPSPPLPSSLPSVFLPSQHPVPLSFLPIHPRHPVPRHFSPLHHPSLPRFCRCTCHWQGKHFYSTAIVVHHTPHLGLIAVDRNTVAASVADIMISFCAYPVEVSAQVVFLHPMHNIAFVAYDPAALGAAAAAAVQPAALKPTPALRRGGRVHLVALSGENQAVMSRKSVVTNPTATLTVGTSDCPRYCAVNMDVVELDTVFGRAFPGVLADESGAVRALWSSFSSTRLDGETTEFTRGVPIAFISSLLNRILQAPPSAPLRPHPPTTPTLPAVPHVESNGHAKEAGEGRRKAGAEELWEMPQVRVLEAKLVPMLLSKARSYGLSDRWVHVLARADPVRRQVLRVKGTLAGSAVAGALQQDDMLLAVDGRPVTCFADVEAACCELDTGAVFKHFKLIKQEEGKAQQYECNNCPLVFSGAAICCAQHLTSWKNMKRREVTLCKNAPADVRLAMKSKYEKQAADAEERQGSTEAAIASVKPGGKHSRITDYLDGDAAAAKREAHQSLALMSAGCHILEQIVDHPLFINAIKDVSHASFGYVPPGRKYIGGSGLQTCRRGIESGLVGIKASWKKVGVTVVFDMMTDRNGRPQVNVFLVNDAGVVMHVCVECNMEKKIGGILRGY
ncbi:unnamed protein product [Closterium sp. Yama58-4]|nr:unnamed protein product [Closterium sp. Yama58-4]